MCAGANRTSFYLFIIHIVMGGIALTIITAKTERVIFPDGTIQPCCLIPSLIISVRRLWFVSCE